MELIPIIKLAVSLFSILAVFVLSVSYIMYRIKNPLKQKKGSIEKSPVIEQSVNPKIKEAYQMVAPVPSEIPVYQHNDQSIQATQRRKQELQREQRVERPKMRLMVVNQQQSDYRVFNATNAGRPFYAPRTIESKKQNVTRKKSVNIFDNYSNGGERLHKINLQVTI